MSNSTKRRSFRRPKLTRAQRLRKRVSRYQRLEVRREHDPVFVQEEILEERMIEQEIELKREEYKRKREEIIAELAAQGLSPSGRPLTPGFDLIRQILPQDCALDEDTQVVAEAVGKLLVKDVDYSTIEKRMLENSPVKDTKDVYGTAEGMDKGGMSQ